MSNKSNQLHLDVTGEFVTPSEPSSSFQVVCNVPDQMAAKYGSSLETDLPQGWKQHISIVATDESSPNTHGSNLVAFEILEHGKRREEHTTTMVNSSTFPNISSSSPSPSRSSLDNLKHPSSPHQSIEIPDSLINQNPTEIINNHPFSPTASNEHPSSPHPPIEIPDPPINQNPTEINNDPSSPIASNEPTQIALATFAAIVELVSTLSNFADNNSSRVKEHQILMYIVLINSTIAFLLSLTALLLLEKRPNAAKKMQKVAFLFGAFGCMGMVGMLMPPTIILWFTVSAFVVCFLIFSITTFM